MSKADCRPGAFRDRFHDRQSQSRPGLIVAQHTVKRIEYAFALVFGNTGAGVVHLQDHVENGQMRFDYKLRDGVITQSNALELMRMIGLDV